MRQTAASHRGKMLVSPLVLHTPNRYPRTNLIKRPSILRRFNACTECRPVKPPLCAKTRVISPTWTSKSDCLGREKWQSNMHITRKQYNRWKGISRNGLVRSEVCRSRGCAQKRVQVLWGVLETDRVVLETRQVAYRYNGGDKDQLSCVESRAIGRRLPIPHHPRLSRCLRPDRQRQRRQEER